VIPLMVCITWVTWPKERLGGLRHWLEVAAFGLMLIIQISWSAYAIKFDHYSRYSPDKEAAEFLRSSSGNGSTIVVTYLNRADELSYSVGILPYFDGRVYANQNEAFWWWSNLNTTEAGFRATLPNHPRFVVAEALQPRPGQPLYLESPAALELYRLHYRVTHVFCGTIPQRLDLWMTTCHVVFQYYG
jgi:hypothetical protein